MLRTYLASALFFCSAMAFANVDVNSASEAELDSIRGIGPSTSRRILDERNKGNFKDWNDLMARTRGIRHANAARLSAAGLTVNGAGFKPAAAASAATD
ncbi:MAG: helix-hairpin-helix domain-containing protein [Rhodoferax sp.]|nr:helix-hairpin-helix domain-containing protein [Rhodoferax sp.]